jgi:hypothetical protein
MQVASVSEAVAQTLEDLVSSGLVNVLTVSRHPQAEEVRDLLESDLAIPHSTTR